MEQLKKHLDTAFKAISKVPVSGDAVDLIALARAELRKAYEEATKPVEAAAAEKEEPLDD